MKHLSFEYEIDGDKIILKNVFTNEDAFRTSPSPIFDELIHLLEEKNVNNVIFDFENIKHLNEIMIETLLNVPLNLPQNKYLKNLITH